MAIKTCLWFDANGHEAAAFYVSLLANSRILSTDAPDPDAPPLVVEFELDGVPYQALNGGSTYSLSPAASIAVTTADQAETDRLWSALIADGGAESRCGWCTDRFGLSWQIVPQRLLDLLSHRDGDVAKRVMETMLAMKKIEIAPLEAAAAAG